MIAEAAELSQLWDASTSEHLTDSASAPAPSLEAARIEERVLSIYRVAAMSAKTAADDDVAGIWQAMAEVCDHACKLLTTLKGRWPQCGVSHDRILDIRNRCQRLAEWHS
jgi:hypothetical protein